MSEEKMTATAALRQAMVNDFTVLERQVSDLTGKNLELQAMHDSLLAERTMLKDELDRRTEQFQKVQAYGARLSAQLDMVTDAVEIWMDHGVAIKGVIAKVKDEARRVQQLTTGTTRTPEPKAEVVTARSVAEAPTTSEALRRLNMIGKG